MFARNDDKKIDTDQIIADIKKQISGFSASETDEDDFLNQFLDAEINQPSSQQSSTTTKTTQSEEKYNEEQFQDVSEIQHNVTLQNKMSQDEAEDDLLSDALTKIQQNVENVVNQRPQEQITFKNKELEESFASEDYNTLEENSTATVSSLEPEFQSVPEAKTFDAASAAEFTASEIQPKIVTFQEEKINQLNTKIDSIRQDIIQETKSSILELRNTLMSLNNNKKIKEQTLEEPSQESFQSVILKLLEPRINLFLEKNLAKIVNDAVKEEIQKIVKESKN
jgi:cell pole-organizing protein PopZ